MRLGDHETILDLGRGGTADLHVARPIAGGDLVILKVLRSPATDKRVQMFRDEARLGALLQHPNVIRTIAIGEDDGQHFIVLELLDGQPLDRVQQRLRAAGRQNEVESRDVLLWILTESLAGLHHAHELPGLRIVHRDFTPQNVFVGYEGRVTTLDFGIAKAEGRMSSTTGGAVKGKVRYMAPEQALGLRSDRRADVFAAGVMLYEIESGTPLWDRASEREVFDDLVGGEYPLSIDGASLALDAALARALARDASERYPTADEMRRDLLAELSRRTDLATLPARTAALVSVLFADQRERTRAMLERALTFA